MGYEEMGRLCISGFVWISVDHYSNESYPSVCERSYKTSWRQPFCSLLVVIQLVCWMPFARMKMESTESFYLILPKAPLSSHLLPGTPLLARSAFAASDV